MERSVPERLAGHRVVRMQTPLVDSVSCYCRVDAGLKTVVGARKFVPGSKLCLQPEIVPNGTQLRNTHKERNRNQAPLLPGLPDDLAIACLIWVPRVEHQNLRLVCKRWNKLLCGNYFYSLRKKLGMAEEWVYVIKRDPDGKISWHSILLIKSGGHFHLFLQIILKLLVLVVLFLVAATFTYLEVKIHQRDQ